MKVLLRAQEHRFAIVPNNRTFREAPCSEFLTKELRVLSYKILLTQELKPTDHVHRREFVNWVLENQKVDGNFLKKIIFGDEAHFQLDGYVNTQNCRIWGAENPRVIHEKPLHAQ